MAELGATPAAGPDLPADLRRFGRRRGELRGDGRIGRRHRRGGDQRDSAPVSASRTRPGSPYVRSVPTAGPNAAPRALGVEALEVAILDRNRAMPRKFRRIKGDRLAALARRRTEQACQPHGRRGDVERDQPAHGCMRSAPNSSSCGDHRHGADRDIHRLRAARPRGTPCTCVIASSATLGWQPVSEPAPSIHR